MQLKLPPTSVRGTSEESRLLASWPVKLILGSVNCSSEVSDSWSRGYVENEEHNLYACCNDVIVICLPLSVG